MVRVSGSLSLLSFTSLSQHSLISQLYPHRCRRLGPGPVNDIAVNDNDGDEGQIDGCITGRPVIAGLPSAAVVSDEVVPQPRNNAQCFVRRRYQHFGSGSRKLPIVDDPVRISVMTEARIMLQEIFIHPLKRELIVGASLLAFVLLSPMSTRVRLEVGGQVC